ncbi:MAG: amidoligase family protein [Muribaculum sp.]|nr:amidoligase family protein [Muribaculum sp.]
MKTLNEEIAAIKAASISKTAKKNALVKLGITNYEISIILDADDNITPAAGRFTFGVEMECFVARGSIRLAAERTGMAYEYEGYNHRDGHSYFKFTTDGSVSGMPNPIECVSPVLQGTKGKADLKKACKTLNKAGAQVNRTCGLHVHIGAAKLTGKQYANVFVNYMYLENLIDSFMAESRRGTNAYYCQTLQDHHGLTRCNSIAEVQREMGIRANGHPRYHKVNAMAYDRHRTIEFRQHQGTTDYEKIINWVNFCGKLVNWSKSNRLTARVASIDEIPFLSEAEKEFFKARASHFASR